MMFAKHQKIHFIGIGGVGMSGIAHILLSMGYRVSGSDLSGNDTTHALASIGAEIYTGHNAENVSSDVTVIVTSTAIPKTNPELLYAAANDIPIIHRSEMLAELMRLRYGIAISGTHGKTTTTSLVSHILTHAELEPTVLIGGKHFNLNSNANFGKSDLLVCEADESDGSFLRLNPVIAIITNIDNDHLDHYGSEHALYQAFLDFMNRVPFYGASFVCFEDAKTRGLCAHATRKVFSYGFDDTYDLYAENIIHEQDAVRFTAHFQGEALGEFVVPLLGEHNVLNTLAAIGCARFLEVPPDAIRAALTSFKGVGRRLNLTYRENGIAVYDDYGHHPTEITATLKAIREVVENRLVVVFQPHRYSRTEMLATEFGQSFELADVVIVTDVYPAGEKPRAGVSGKLIHDAIEQNNGHKELRYVADKKLIPETLRELTREGDTVLTLGAGDIFKMGEAFVQALRKN